MGSQAIALETGGNNPKQRDRAVQQPPAGTVLDFSERMEETGGGAQVKRLLSLLELADMSLFPLTLSDASPRYFNYCLHLAVRFPLPTQITFWSVNAFVTSITQNFCTIWPEIQHVCWMGRSFVFFARYLDLDYIYNLIITH